MKLNIGCGEKKLAGWVNVDLNPVDPDVVFGDLERGLDLPDACADEILLDNVIEHVESVVSVMIELRRLLKPDGTVKILTPHYSSHSSWRDPTHRHHLSFFSFDNFCRERNAHYLGGARFRMVHKKLSFGGGLSVIGRLIFRISPELYERKYAFIFPASTITVVLSPA